MRVTVSKQSILRLIYRNLATKCDTEPSSSIEKKLQSTLSFTEYIKVKYPEKLELLNQQVENLNEQRLEIKKNAGFRHFFKDLSSQVLQKSSCDLICVGSMVTKFVNNKSDFDFVFFPTNDEQRHKFLRDFHQNPSFKQNFMSVFAKLLERESRKLGEPVEKIVELPRLRVPLLIIQFESGLSMDIQFPDQNYHAIRNTQLVRCYKQCDERFTLLFLWLRTICDRFEIRNSKYSLLSSYHLLLLVVHFLQSERALSPWPVLPVLSKTHPKIVSGDLHISQVADWIKLDPPSIDYQSHNKMAISELIVRFVDYYHHFDPSKEAIYIEKGLALKRKQTFGDVKLQIIDPYSPISVCRSSHAATAFFNAITFIKSKFRQDIQKTLGCHAPLDLFAVLKNGFNELLNPAGPPVVRNNVIRNGSCAGGEILISTTWNYDNIPQNQAKMDANIRKLEKYSGISTSEFSPNIKKEPMNLDGKFGVKYTIDYLTSSCDRVRLFVRKAVSWGSDITRARVRCECEPIIVLTKS